VVSSDEIRAELFAAAPAAAGSEAADARIFEERDRGIVARLASGRGAVAESTNVTPRARARPVAIARRFDAPVTVLRFAPDGTDLLQQYAGGVAPTSPPRTSAATPRSWPGRPAPTSSAPRAPPPSTTSPGAAKGRHPRKPPRTSPSPEPADFSRAPSPDAGNAFRRYANSPPTWAWQPVPWPAPTANWRPHGWCAPAAVPAPASGTPAAGPDPHRQLDRLAREYVRAARALGADDAVVADRDRRRPRRSPLPEPAADVVRRLGSSVRRTVSSGRRQGAVEINRDLQQAMKEVAAAAVDCADVADALTTLLVSAQCLFDSDVAYLSLPDHDLGTFSFDQLLGIRTSDFRHLRIREGQGLGGLARSLRRPVRSLNCARDSRLHAAPVAETTSEGIVSAMATPIIVDDQVQAVRYVGDRTLRPFSETDEEVLGEFAAYATLGLKRPATEAYRRDVLRRQEQERLAYDLHDTAVRGLLEIGFAAEQVCENLSGDPAVQARLGRSRPPPNAVWRRCAASSSGCSTGRRSARPVPCWGRSPRRHCVRTPDTGSSCTPPTRYSPRRWPTRWSASARRRW
jgi:GAF domain-containing protein